METTKSTKRQVRPIQFYKDAWRIFHELIDNEYSETHLRTPKCDQAVEAFKRANKLHPTVQLSGCMSNRKTAHSYMMDDVKRKIEKQINLTP